MTSEMKAARTLFVNAVEKAQAALAKTQEWKTFQDAKKQLESFESTFRANDDEPVAQKGTVTATATVRRGAAAVTPTRGKPGPKPKAQPAVAKKAAKAALVAKNDKPKGKPGPKPGTKRTAAPVKAAPENEAGSKIREGRQAVLRGDRPPLREAMVTVLGTKTLDALKTAEALESRGWLPDTEDPRAYVSMTFSKNPTIFERVERGQYRVKESFRKKANGIQKNGKRGAKASSNPTTEEALAELGIKPGAVADNPFSETTA